ncbi:fibronectin type III domain-containing protein [Spirillospora sp. CA-108201]
MICCRPSRRALLRWSAIVAGASLLPAVEASSARASDDVQPVNLELVTVTETTAVLTWYTGVPGTDDGLGRMEPAPSDAEVLYGTHPSRLTSVAHGSSGTPNHYVELTGLEPGRTYYYRARSRGRGAAPTWLAAGQTPHVV